MTPAQDDALKQILDIMREHFDAGLIVVEGENGDNHTEVQSAYHGNYPTAIGLAELAKLHVYKSTMKP